ncbi:hypothetical protein [Mangrovibacterium marinum]|uniref:Tetratricopeptide repeat protein n=1 Tax=Mangrovibacterium marinum TaxID=1639118 RepID=A0A2T5BYR8_9BACT|nr:hypothetical protein [Mangrovibacterium marinum]PTN07385.1 hypothetical protein C8N47_11838 [Mangrovibacterium marinum]
MSRPLFLLGWLLLLVAASGWAQVTADSIRCRLYHSYVNDRMEQWPALIRTMKSRPDTSASWQQEIALARYGLAGYYVGNNRAADAELEITKALAELELAQTIYPNEAGFWGLEAGFRALQIRMFPMKTPFFYAAHQAAMNKAQEREADDPFFRFEQGMMLLHKPRLLGGDKRKALELFEQSRAMLKAQPFSTCCWFGLMVDLFRLKAYDRLNDEEAYQALYDAITREHGSLTWLPRFLKM